MVQNPFGIFFVLLAIEAMVLSAAAFPSFRKFFHYIPAVFWIYALPMAVSSMGIISDQSPLYDRVIACGLPASLFLLLLGVDLGAVARLGRTAVLIFFAGSFGMMAGSAASFALFSGVVGPEFWSGFGALSASWMGGSANMVAVKEALGTPDHIFLPMVVVDTVVPYLWMGVLVFASTWQKDIDRWNRADCSVLDHIRQRMQGVESGARAVLSWRNTIMIGAAAFAVSWFLRMVAAVLPVVAGVISPFTWTIILVSAVGLACSLTSLRKWEARGSTRIGYYLLYFVLTTIGARASVTRMGDSLVLIAAGFVIVAVHALVLLAAARWLKAPLMLVASASQANIGGAASAPVVAEIYQPGLSAIGLLMAVLGNIAGTYLGILTGQICRRLAAG